MRASPDLWRIITYATTVAVSWRWSTDSWLLRSVVWDSALAMRPGDYAFAGWLLESLPLLSLLGFLMLLDPLLDGVTRLQALSENQPDN